MVSAPIVSVIVATCRRAALALDAVRSVLADGFADLEVIVVDQDPGRPLEARLAAAFPGERRLRYVHLDRAVLSAARNAGVAAARGEILHFLDDDALVVPGCLRAYAEAFASTAPPPGIVAGRLEPLWQVPRPRWLPASLEYLLGVYDRGGVLAPLPAPDLPVGANFAVSRAAAEAIGPFDERLGFSLARRPGGLGGEDSLFAVRARRLGLGVLYQPAALARHRISGNKLSRRAFLRRCYWEGATGVAVEHLAGEAGLGEHRDAGGRAPGGLARDLLRLLELRHGRLRLASDAERMEILARCALGWGAMQGARRARRQGAGA